MLKGSLADQSSLFFGRGSGGAKIFPVLRPALQPTQSFAHWVLRDLFHMRKVISIYEAKQ
jgi:hypothetical protein